MGAPQAALPLEGIRILDLSRLIPGGVCTAMLADLGAEVIKVESTVAGDYERQIPPFIGEMASRFLILNRNKKSFAVNLKDRNFIGAQALRQLKQESSQPCRVGLRVTGKRIARDHYPILAEGRAIGEVTSGTFSPTLEASIAMGMIAPAFTNSGPPTRPGKRQSTHRLSVIMRSRPVQ